MHKDFDSDQLAESRLLCTIDSFYDGFNQFAPACNKHPKLQKSRTYPTIRLRRQFSRLAGASATIFATTACSTRARSIELRVAVSVAPLDRRKKAEKIN